MLLPNQTWRFSPMAWQSLSAWLAAIWPNRYGSVTIARKKSTVCTCRAQMEALDFQMVATRQWAALCTCYENNRQTCLTKFNRLPSSQRPP